MKSLLRMEEPIDFRCFSVNCCICHFHPNIFHNSSSVIPSGFMKKSQIIWKKVKGRWGSHKTMQHFKEAPQTNPELQAREEGRLLDPEHVLALVLVTELVSMLLPCKQRGSVSGQVLDPPLHSPKMIGTRWVVFVLVITLGVMLHRSGTHPFRHDVG